MCGVDARGRETNTYLPRIVVLPVPLKYVLVSPCPAVPVRLPPLNTSSVNVCIWAALDTGPLPHVRPISVRDWEVCGDPGAGVCRFPEAHRKSLRRQDVWMRSRADLGGAPIHVLWLFVRSRFRLRVLLAVCVRLSAPSQSSVPWDHTADDPNASFAELLEKRLCFMGLRRVRKADGGYGLRPKR